MYKQYSKEYIGSKFREDAQGRLYRIDTIGTYSEESISKFAAEGRIYHYPSGKIGLIRYLDEAKGEPVSDIWSDIPEVNSQALERCNFETQKPEELLKRILEASSGANDLVADFFCGSGTTLSVAEKLNRRWIGCELGKVGIQVARGRLVEQKAKPFLIENIGNYQREMIYLTGGRIYEMQHLILQLYGATPRDKLSGLGIRRGEDGVEELVYVGYPDRPITARRAEELTMQAQKLDGRGYKRLIILGWDYDGFTFKSPWQAFRGNGKKAKTVATEAKEILDRKKRTIAVRVVDIFGNDAGAVIEAG